MEIHATGGVLAVFHHKISFYLLVLVLPLFLSTSANSPAHDIASLQFAQIVDLKSRLHGQIDGIASKLRNPNRDAIDQAHNFVGAYKMEDSLAMFVARRMTKDEMAKTAAFLQSKAGKKFMAVRKEMDSYFIARGSLVGLEVFDKLRSGHPNELREDSATASMRTSMQATFRNLESGAKH